MSLDINAINRRYEALKTERAGWDSAWEQLAELFLPTRWRSDSDTTAYKDPKINGRLLNSRGVLAMRVLAAGMQGGMTSPARPWFRLTLKGNEGGGEWLDEVTRRMRLILHQSNFYNCVHGLYGDLATFGTALLVETANEDGLVFHLVRAGEYALDVNGNGEVDTFFRRIYMTARQIVERFGQQSCPQTILNAAEGHNGQGSTTRFSVIHGVFPRTDIDYSASIGPQSMPFVSVYWLLDGGASGNASILSQGGFHSFPAFAPRWDVCGTDVYGRSPAMDIAPDVKMLQAMTKTLRLMQHRIADPPVVADTSLKTFGVNLNPGALNFAPADAVLRNGAVQPIQQPQPQALNYTMQAIAETEKTVSDGLYTDLFRLLIDDDRKNITATEVQARQQEKMILIGPVVERLHKELLEPLITRTFQLMEEYGALPPLPDELAGRELDVTFESVLAQAQKLTATSAIDQGWAFALNTAQAMPQALDNIDVDSMLKSYLTQVGMPEGCINDDGAIQQIRQERAQAQQMAQQQEQAQAAIGQATELSQAAKNLGQTPLGADGATLMDTLIGGIGSI